VSQGPNGFRIFNLPLKELNSGEKAWQKAQYIWEGEGCPRGLCWSPEGAVLAYHIEGPGGSGLYLLTPGEPPLGLGPGSSPAWSPDGRALAVERGTELWLVDREGKYAFPLRAGRSPAWSSKGHLAFIAIRSTERIMGYGPDGSPRLTVRRLQEEIRQIYLDTRGAGLEENKLKNIQDRPLWEGDGEDPEALKWLFPEGSSEPRTVYHGSFEALWGYKLYP